MTEQSFRSDPHRPVYHFVPPSNWMNDPNGLIEWNGEYHLFYQYNPVAAVWGPMHWGHAVSSDLVRWRHLPIALAPTPGGPDADGCWSGVAVNDNGVPTLVYSGHNTQAGRPNDVQLPCVAVSHDRLSSWEKDAANPVIAAPPEHLDVLAFRDHCVWRENGVWKQAIGAGVRGQGGVVFLYQSENLREWQYIGQLAEGESEESGQIWECPDFFALGDRHVLIVSPIPLQRSIYFTGAYNGERFQPMFQGEVDAGGYLYAPQSFTDSQGRRVMFGWLWEGRTEAARVEAGWAGVMSLPRVISLRGDGGLHFAPADEVALLRGNHRAYRAVALAPDDELVLDPAAGNLLDLEVAIEPGNASSVSLVVCRSPDGAEQTRITYDVAAGSLNIDRRRSSADQDTQAAPAGHACLLGSDKTLRLRVLLDRSVLEVFTADGVCLTSRIYPTRRDSLGLALEATGGTARLAGLDMWDMRPVWE